MAKTMNTGGRKRTIANTVGVAVLFAVVFVFANYLYRLMRMNPKQIADSPDGQFRAYAGIRSQLGLIGPATYDYATVEIGLRHPSLGGAALTTEPVFICLDSNQISAQWEDSHTLKITVGCLPMNEKQGGESYSLGEYKGIRIMYAFNGDWRGVPVHPF